MKRAPCSLLRASVMGELAVDRSPGETRAVVYEDGDAVELHIQRAGMLWPGDVVSARIVERSNQGVFAETGTDETLLISGAASAPVGATINVEIIRSAQPEPGQRKCASARVSDAAPVRVDSLASLLAAHHEIAPPEDFEAAFDCAVAGQVNVNQATVWFERTKAGLVCDVDGPGAHVNEDAACAVACLLRLFQISGAVMVDFISTDNKAARNAIAAVFDHASIPDPRPFERTAINGFGLMQIIRPRATPSVLDVLYGTNRMQLSLETQALRLIRDASRSAGFGPRQIIVAPALAAYLARPEYAEHIAAAARFAGAPVEIVADAEVAGYGHVHVRQA